MKKKAVKNSKKAKSKKVSILEPDRIIPRMEGGTYTPDNVIKRTPLEHAHTEGRIVSRDEQLTTIKATIDDRRKYIQVRNSLGNKLFAWSPRGLDEPSAAIKDITEKRDDLDKKIDLHDKMVTKQINAYALEDPLTAAALRVAGVGPVTIAYMLTYVKLEKAPNPSSLWAYVGLDQANHVRKSKHTPEGLMEKRRRRGHEFYCVGEDCLFCKGEKERLVNKEGLPMGWGGHQVLRTQLHVAASTWLKQRTSAYRPEYDRVKARLEVSEKSTHSRRTGKKGVVENAWKDAPAGHRHGAAMRAMIKQFLADYWHVGRTLMGLPNRGLYVEEYLGHQTITSPKERGWECSCERCEPKKVRKAAKRA